MVSMGKILDSLVMPFSTFSDKSQALFSEKSAKQTWSITSSKTLRPVGIIVVIGLSAFALAYFLKPALSRAYSAALHSDFANRLTKRIHDLFHGLFPAKPEKKAKSNEVELEKVEREKKIAQIEQEFQGTLTQIASDLKRDLLPDESVVSEKYKILSTFFTQLPQALSEQKKLELRTLINHVLIEKELRNKGKLLGKHEAEIDILKNLNIKPEEIPEYYDKECLYKVITAFITKELALHSNEQIQLSSGEIRKIISYYALKARLGAVGIKEEEKITKFQLFLNFEDYLGNLKVPQAAIKSMFEKIATNAAIQPKTKKSITECYEFLMSSFLRKKTKSCIRGGQEKFNTAGNLEDFARILEKKKNEIEKAFNEKIEKDTDSILEDPEVKFLLKWSKNLKQECYQGQSDANEVLGFGVCWAVVQRVESHSRAYPNLGPKDVFTGEIQSIDRVNQAKYAATITTNSEAPFEKTTLFDIKTENSPLNLELVEKNIKDQIRTIQASHGWLKLGIFDEEGGHAISLRLDKNHKKFWLLDANIGLFDFEDGNQTPEESIQECLECFKDLMTLLYPTKNQIVGSQRG